MSRNLERIKREAADHVRDYSDTSARARDISDMRKRVSEELRELDSLDDDVIEALEAAEADVKQEAKEDFDNTVESSMDQIDASVRDTQGDINRSVDESAVNRGKLESIARGSDYGVEGIGSAAQRAEQMGDAYSEIGSDLRDKADTARREIEERKRELDS